MLDYKAYLENIISRRDYSLADLEEKIDKCWLDNKISEADRDELMQLAADNAKDSLQVDVIAKLANLEERVFALEHPEPEYPIWEQGQTSLRGVVYRYDVTGDGEYDLVRYDGGREYTSLSIGKIEGWHLLNDQLENVATITRDASGGYVITPVNADSPDLSAMTKAELVAYAEDHGIEVSSSWTKAEIIAAIEAAAEGE